MALADHLPKAGPKQCGYARALLMLTPEDAEQLKTAMGNPIYPTAHIAKALKGNNTPYVGESTLGDHRRGVCVCTR